MIFTLILNLKYIRGEKELDENRKIYPSLLTKSELDWLLGNYITISKSYEYKMKSSIRRKWQTFVNLELPLLQKSGIISDDLTVFGKDLTTYSKVDNPINYSNNENCAQKWWAGRDLNPRTPPCQGGILTKLDHRPVAQIALKI